MKTWQSSFVVNASRRVSFNSRHEAVRWAAHLALPDMIQCSNECIQPIPTWGSALRRASSPSRHEAVLRGAHLAPPDMRKCSKECIQPLPIWGSAQRSASSPSRHANNALPCFHDALTQHIDSVMTGNKQRYYLVALTTSQTDGTAVLYSGSNNITNWWYSCTI